jgi:manganese oxidase
VFGSGVIQPRFSKFLDSTTGEKTNRGTQITVTNPLIPDYRDLALFAQDFTFLFDKNGDPIEPPEFPNSLDDPGVFGVNYKNEPLKFRLGKDNDPAYSFSSFVKGDPVTPILKAYAGDPIRIRLLQGAHEESHSFNIHGLRWKSERPDIETKFQSQQHIGISESFTFESYIPRPGDYLWTFETEEDLWLGLWGLIRAFAEEVDDLIALQDRPTPPIRTNPLPKTDGNPPPPAKEIKSVGPPDAPVRRYHVVAFQTDIVYNSRFNEQTPFGVIFALEEEVDDILNKKKKPEPLILRGNVGEVVEITLSNRLEKDRFEFPNGIYPYPPVKVQAFYPPSLRISLHPQLLQFDVQSSAGETVGFNPDQTVGPGETITYRWYVDEAVGSCVLWDMADIRNHRSQGAFGAFIAEPRGTKYLHPYTLHPVKNDLCVVLRNPFLPDTREFVLVMHDGVRLFDKNNNVIIDPKDGVIGKVEDDLTDTYDNGSRGFNYRTERLINRFNKSTHTGNLFSSKVFGTPATPLLEAYPGDPVTIRLVNPAERRRSHTFHLHGHYWNIDDKDITSSTRSVVGQIVAGHTADLMLIGGAGGLYNFPGDYMYRSGNIRWDIEQGMWGIFRVYKDKNLYLSKINQKKKGNK